jgi:hypothetical protein
MIFRCITICERTLLPIPATTSRSKVILIARNLTFASDNPVLGSSLWSLGVKRGRAERKRGWKGSYRLKNGTIDFVGVLLSDPFSACSRFACVRKAADTTRRKFSRLYFHPRCRNRVWLFPFVVWLRLFWVCVMAYFTAAATTTFASKRKHWKTKNKLFVRLFLNLNI